MIVTSSLVESMLYSMGRMNRMFTNDPEDRGSIPGRVILNSKKMVLDTALLNTHLYKVRIKGKVGQSRKWSSALHYISVE